MDTSKALEENLKMFYDELQKLKVDRILKKSEVDESLLLSKKVTSEVMFKFETGKEVSFKIGKKLAIGQSFYLRVLDGDKSTWLVTRFETAYSADAADKGRNRSSAPYEKFIEILHTPKSFFYTELKK